MVELTAKKEKGVEKDLTSGVIGDHKDSWVNLEHD